MSSFRKMMLPLIVLTGLPLGAVRADRVPGPDWYRPAPADFWPSYERDSVNKRSERWDGRGGYWYWVQTFYTGYTKKVLGLTVVHSTGWTADGEALAAHIAAPAARERLIRMLNPLGRQIAQEWAKDDRHCRINTDDLRRWAALLTRAAARDDGSGAQVLPTTEIVQNEADRKLGASR